MRPMIFTLSLIFMTPKEATSAEPTPAKPQESTEIAQSKHPYSD